MSAAREYRDVVAELTRAADALRSRDLLRVEELKQQLRRADAELTAAEERATLSRLVVDLHWEAVVDALWQEAWMTLRLPPEPDRDADPERLEEWEADVDRAATEVLDAVRRRTFGFRRR